MQAQKRLEKAAIEAWKKGIADVPRKFVAAKMGPTTEGLKERIKMLDRLKSMAPDLPQALQFRWELLRYEYAEHFPAMFPRKEGCQ
jgi:hypothetical protein